MSLLGIDIGTTGCKAAAFDEEGRLLAYSYREYNMENVGEQIYELNPCTVWQKVKEVIYEINSRVKNNPVIALSASVSGDEVVPVDKDRKCLYNVIMSMDKRGSEELSIWLNGFSRRDIYNKTGLPLHPKYGVNRILWLRNHKPDIYKKVWKFLTWEDFIHLRLGIDDTFCSSSTITRIMLVNIESQTWDEDLLSHVQLDKSMFSHIVSPGTMVGRVSRKVCEELGFIKQPFVVSGGFDQSCAALGAGITKKGMAMVGTGTMEAIVIYSHEPVLSEEFLNGNYPWNLHVLPKSFNCSATNIGGGLLLKWFRDEFCSQELDEANKEGRNIYDLMLEGLAQKPTGALLLPHFAGSGPPSKDPDSLGGILGLTTSFSKKNMIQCILEGITYELRQNIEFIEKNGNLPVSSIRAVGGGSRSDYWLQLKANITGKPVEKPLFSEAGCLAAAILAGLGVGIYNDAASAADMLITIDKVFEPDWNIYNDYSEYFQTYKCMYPSTKEISHKLKELRKSSIHK